LLVQFCLYHHVRWTVCLLAIARLMVDYHIFTIADEIKMGTKNFCHMK
jgi:hypothetical protein